MRAAGERAEHWLLEWWLSSWEPSYREVRLSDLRSVEDLSAIVYDAGVQLGAGEAKDAAVRKQELSSLSTLEGRLRKETSSIVAELLADGASWGDDERRRGNIYRSKPELGSEATDARAGAATRFARRKSLPAYGGDDSGSGR